MKIEFSGKVSEKTLIPNFMKIRLLGVKLYHGNGRKEKRTWRSWLAFRNSAKSGYKLFKSVNNIHTVHSPTAVPWPSSFLNVQSQFSVDRILFRYCTIAFRTLLKSEYEIPFKPYGGKKFSLSDWQLKYLLRFVHCACLLTYLIAYLLNYLLTHSME